MNDRDLARRTWLTLCHLWRIRNPHRSYTAIAFPGVPESEELVTAKETLDYYLQADVLPVSTDFASVGRQRKRMLFTCRARLYAPNDSSGKLAYDLLESLEDQIDTAALANSVQTRGINFRAAHIDYRGPEGDYHVYALTCAMQYDRDVNTYEHINQTVTDGGIVPQGEVLNEFATILDDEARDAIFGSAPVIFNDGQFQGRQEPEEQSNGD